MVAGVGGGSAAMDPGDGLNDGQAEAEPSWEVRSLSRWNGWKMRSASRGLMIGPVLFTVNWLLPAMVRVLIQISPVSAL